MDPVPDLIHIQNYRSAGNRTRDLHIVANFRVFIYLFLSFFCFNKQTKKSCLNLGWRKVKIRWRDFDGEVNYLLQDENLEEGKAYQYHNVHSSVLLHLMFRELSFPERRMVNFLKLHSPDFISCRTVSPILGNSEA